MVRQGALEEWINAALILARANQTVSALPRAAEFKLANGMDVVVVPDHRAPIVTHMVWYRAGVADEPKGVSGIAQLLEHLTFKSLDKGAGGLSKAIARCGGQNNAFTSRDMTVYFERVSKDQLETAMKIEASRMMNLHLTDDEVAIERQVVIEMRRSCFDSNPTMRLNEKMGAALYQVHPYGIPAVGCADEMAKLSRKDVMRFYKRYYAPNNAVLVVSGDVLPEEVARLAERTYGKLRPNPGVNGRERPQEPPHVVARRVTLEDARAGDPVFRRVYAVPSYAMAKPGEAEALDLLATILGAPATGRLNRKLVVETKLAAETGGCYSGTDVDAGTISIFARGRDGDLSAIEAGVDTVLEEIRNHGVTQLEFSRAKKVLLAKYIFESDCQENLAHRYGWAIAIGHSVDQVEGWPAAISKVTADDIKRVANEYLDARRSVTGWLLPESEHAAIDSARRGQAHNLLSVGL